MSNILFQTNQLQHYWLDCIGMIDSYYMKFSDYDFESAKKLAEELSLLVTDYKRSSDNNFPDEFYNDCFIFNNFASLLSAYADYWSQVCVNLYPESWDTLQDVLDLLRLINKFTCFDRTLLFKFLQRQTQAFEPLYPYRLFASIEVVIGKTTCSICGKNMESLDCDHIAGELYRGKLACGIVEEIKEVLAMALVENPADKRCKISAVEGESLNFEMVEYLRELVLIKKFNPLRISHTQESTRRIKIAESPDVGRNEACPCGSGKKFKKCCIDKEYTEKNHIKILVLSNKGLSLNDFKLISSEDRIK